MAGAAQTRELTSDPPAVPKLQTPRLLLRRLVEADAHRNEAHIEPDNAASLSLAERLSFRREGLMRDCLFVDG